MMCYMDSASQSFVIQGEDGGNIEQAGQKSF
jgi:hypothetical protein